MAGAVHNAGRCRECSAIPAQTIAAAQFRRLLESLELGRARSFLRSSVIASLSAGAELGTVSDSLARVSSEGFELPSEGLDSTFWLTIMDSRSGLATVRRAPGQVKNRGLVSYRRG